MSCLNYLHKKKLGIVSVGASGALFGLLGAMLSEILTNWTIYANKINYMSSGDNRIEFGSWLCSWGG